MDEAASQIRMESNLKLDNMENLYRHTVQLKMQYEQIKKEENEPIKKRLDVLREEIQCLKKRILSP